LPFIFTSRAGVKVDLLFNPQFRTAYFTTLWFIPEYTTALARFFPFRLGFAAVTTKPFPHIHYAFVGDFVRESPYKADYIMLFHYAFTSFGGGGSGRQWVIAFANTCPPEAKDQNPF
jgi:hypothetical protein